MLAGGNGVISVTANVAPALMRELCATALSGEHEQSQEIDDRLQPLHSDLFVEANPIPAKWAVFAMGLIEAGIRLPLTWLSEDAQPTVRDAMSSAGVDCAR